MRKLVFTFGRFQVPTVGHEKLINRVVSEARRIGADHRIYLSHSQDAKTNPLPYRDKLRFMKKLFPKANIHESNARNAYQVMEEISGKYDEVILVVGDDRVPEMEKSISKYVNNGTYDVKKFSVVSAGKRDPNAKGVEGASGTKIREFIRSGDFKSFAANCPTNNEKLARDIFNLARQKLMVNESNYLVEGLNDPAIFKCVFLAGGPGSGKDYVLGKLLRGYGLRELNSDQAFEFLMKKHNISMVMRNASTERDEIRGRAKVISKERERLYLMGRLGIIINGTGDDPTKVAQCKKMLEDLGYDTAMVFVKVSNDVSRQRNVERGQLGGREVPETIRNQKWHDSVKNIPIYSRMFGPMFVVVDNSVDTRYADRETVSKVEKGFSEMYKFMRKFVAKRPSGPMVDAWIASELQRRKIERQSPTVDMMREGFSNFMRTSFPATYDAIEQMILPKGYDKAVEKYIKRMSSPRGSALERHHTPAGVAAEIASEYGISPRQLTKYLRKLVQDGKLDKRFMVGPPIRESKTLKSFLEEAEMIHRSKMPQIKVEDYQKFKAFLKAKGISCELKMVDVDDITPRQNIQQKYVKQIADGRTIKKHDTPIFLDKDYNIIDGHHRWAVNKQMGNDKIKAYVIGTNWKRAFEVSHDFNTNESLNEEAEYQGRKVTLDKPMKSDNPDKKRMVYVKNDKGNVIKVYFGDPNMEIKRDDPERRKAFRSRHGCDNPGPKWKAKYWSCKYWDDTPVSEL